MKTKTLKYDSSLSLNNEKKYARVFSSLDNHKSHLQHGLKSMANFKSIQPNKQNNDIENRDSHVFISSPYKSKPHPSSALPSKPIKMIRQTFTTNKNNERTEATFTGRPTMGGKTIGAIHHLPATTTLHHHNRMSSQELKLLSRRINPHEPLSSPHASPTKPPLPTIIRKRPMKDKMTLNKRTKTKHEFSCEPCHKVYKTRAGFSYHKEKCKYHKFEVISKAIINCICPNPTDDSGTMIECIQCNHWLHLKCANGVTREEDFCCPRCIESNNNPFIVSDLNLLATPDICPLSTTSTISQSNLYSNEEQQDYICQNGKTINLSDLHEAKERGKNLMEALKQSSQDRTEPNTQYNFVDIFREDHQMTLEPPNSTLSPQLMSSITQDDFWHRQDNNNNEWCSEELPSLLFSDNNPSSFIDDFSNDVPSSPQQSDWFHFANFENDFSLG